MPLCQAAAFTRQTPRHISPNFGKIFPENFLDARLVDINSIFLGKDKIWHRCETPKDFLRSKNQLSYARRLGKGVYDRQVANRKAALEAMGVGLAPDPEEVEARAEGRRLKARVRAAGKRASAVVANLAAADAEAPVVAGDPGAVSFAGKTPLDIMLMRMRGDVVPDHIYSAAKDAAPYYHGKAKATDAERHDATSDLTDEQLEAELRRVAEEEVRLLGRAKASRIKRVLS